MKQGKINRSTKLLTDLFIIGRNKKRVIDITARAWLIWDFWGRVMMLGLWIWPRRPLTLLYWEPLCNDWGHTGSSPPRALSSPQDVAALISWQHVNTDNQFILWLYGHVCCVSSVWWKWWITAGKHQENEEREIFSWHLRSTQIESRPCTECLCSSVCQVFPVFYFLYFCIEIGFFLPSIFGKKKLPF